MHKRGKAFLGFSVLLLFAAAIIPAHTDAQNVGRLDLTTSPLPINLKIRPGETLATDLRVKNSGTTSERLKASLMKFSAFGEEGKPQLAEREQGDDYFDWVSFSETEFTAEPNVWKTIKMTIDVPDSAAFGYYYAVVFSRANPDEVTGDQTGLRGGAAVLVLLDVDVPGSRRDVSIAEFGVSRKSYEFLPANFTVKMRNEGNVHVAPTGTIFITRGGKEVGAVPFNDSGGNILPASNRIYTAEWSDGFPRYETVTQDDKVVTDDNNQPKKSLAWDLSEIQSLRYGKYQATLVAIYDDGEKDIPIEATISFWVIPWRIIGGLLLILALIGFGIWSLVRSILKKIKKGKARA